MNRTQTVPLLMGISKKRNAKVTRKRQFSRTTVYKRLSDFFVCTSRMSGIVHTILRIERKHLALYTTIKDSSNAKIMRKRQLSRTAVCKRLSDFFICTSRISGIVYSILRIERSEKQKGSAFLQSCSV